MINVRGDIVDNIRGKIIKVSKIVTVCENNDMLMTQVGRGVRKTYLSIEFFLFCFRVVDFYTPLICRPY